MDELRSSHGVSVSERAAVVLTGIESIEGFDEENIIMKTHTDGLSIQGHGLHVDKFDSETGEMICSGIVDAIVYYNVKKTSEKKRWGQRGR